MGGGAPAGPAPAVGALLQALTEARAASSSSASSSPSSSSSSTSSSTTAAAAVADGSTLRRLMSARREALVREEKTLLTRVVALLEEEVAPALDELPLLRDAAAALDDPFLLVVVGEFNSGKSSVINALLGERYLADGILPTTNEISLLAGDDAGGGASGGGGSGGGAVEAAAAAGGRVEQRADGLYVRYLPAGLLREINIVDTPGIIEGFGLGCSVVW